MPGKPISILLLIAAILLFISAFMVPEILLPSGNALETDLLFQYRVPKTLTAFFLGVSLSVSGFILQQLFRNNLAGPYILGVSSGASLAVAFVIIGAHFLPFLDRGISIPLAGALGAAGILLLVLSVSSRYGNGAIILLFGVIIGQISSALLGVLNYMAVPGDLKYFALWSMGSFNQVYGNNLYFLITCASLCFIWAFSMMPGLSVMVLGNDVAGTLGVRPKRLSFRLIACTGILTGVCTAFCGPVAFIGMAIPNVARMVYKTTDFRSLLIINALLGAIMALTGDIVSSTPLFGLNIPVNVCMALIGGPFILFVLLKKRPE